MEPQTPTPTNSAPLPPTAPPEAPISPPIDASSSNPSTPLSNPPSPQKSKIGIVVLAVIVLAIAALGGGIFVMSQANKPTAQTTQAQAIVPTPTQTVEQNQLETVTIQDPSGDVATIEASLENL